MKKHIKSNVHWIGYIDWELEKFHGEDYSITNGSSQNAYLIQEEKTVLIDTVWNPHGREFVDNLKKEIDLKEIDYIIMNHGEPDHAGALPLIMEEIPDTPIYCTANGVKSLQGQFHGDWDYHIVKTGDTLDIGNGKELIFVEMMMLHWPDSMATYLTKDNILFSNDAFGQHYAVAELFDDMADPCTLEKEAMKYYANILTPFSSFASRKIQEIVDLDLPIDMICPSHGVIWRENPMSIVEKYAQWADDYQENQITIVYDTMWGGTEKIAHELAKEIGRISPDTRVKVFNISKQDKNEIILEVFKSKALAVGAPTVGNEVLSSMGGWLYFLKSLKFKKKKAGAFGCYGWSGESVKIIGETLKQGGFELVDTSFKIQWNPKKEDLKKVKELARELTTGAS
ncbi:MAG: MBL fold metallo-hydrolase [Tissierellia bacterium]|nr:MBL fold metallo-hydrolase [Tissierellia bacterium]